MRYNCIGLKCHLVATIAIILVLLITGPQMMLISGGILVDKGVSRFSMRLPLVGAILTGRGGNQRNSEGDTGGGATDTPDGVECKDGVCNIKNSKRASTSAKTLEEKIIEDWKGAEGVSEDSEEDAANADIKDAAAALKQSAIDESSIAEVIKLGYSREEALRALRLTSGDVVNAATMLEEEEEELEKLRKDAQLLVKEHDWDDAAAFAALQQCDGNVTAAHQLLTQEEEYLQHNFEESVQDMLKNGWEEIVARQALLAQWTIEKRRQSGANVSISEDVVKAIKPTLHRLNDTSVSKKPESVSSAANNKQKQSPMPKPAKKEDVVFDVTASNFQKIVIESPVPVLVDVYADWCGPCKQLGPMLEQAAVKAGGLFRLAKVNSDNERAIAGTLDVSGLPTVYAVSNGKFTDRFVGMLPGTQLQTFLQRAVTGFGDRVQKDMSESELLGLTMKITNFAGLSSMTFKRKEKLFALVDAAMEAEGTFVPQKNFVLTSGIKTALQLINNCRGDIRNPKFRRISLDSKLYQEKIKLCPAASQLLEVAGFKVVDEKETKNMDLVHSNAAILSLVQQRVDDYISAKKFARMKGGPGAKLAKKSSPQKYPSAAAGNTAPSNFKKKEGGDSKTTEPASVAPVPVKKSSRTGADAAGPTVRSAADVTSSSKRRKQRKKQDIYGSSSWKSSGDRRDEDNEFVEIFGGDSTVTIARVDRSSDGNENETDKVIESAVTSDSKPHRDRKNSKRQKKVGGKKR